MKENIAFLNFSCLNERRQVFDERVFYGQLHLHCGIVYWLNCDEVFALSTTFSLNLTPKVEQYKIIVYIFNYKKNINYKN